MSDTKLIIIMSFSSFIFIAKCGSFKSVTNNDRIYILDSDIKGQGMLN